MSGKSGQSRRIGRVAVDPVDGLAHLAAAAFIHLHRDRRRQDSRAEYPEEIQKNFRITQFNHPSAEF